MKNMLVRTGFFIAVVATAFSAHSASLPEVRKEIFEKSAACDQAVFSDDQFMAVSLNQGGLLGRTVQVTSLKNPEQVLRLSFAARVSDIKIENGTLYVLTERTLEAFKLIDGSRVFAYATRPGLSLDLALGHTPGYTVTEDWRLVASGFILHNGRAVISHSVLGFTVLDLRDGSFVKLIDMPTRSSAQDIALLNANEAVIAVDNDAEATFRGLYILNLQTLTVTRQIKVDNAFPSSVRVLSGNRLMLNFFNAIWKFDLNRSVQATEAKPLIRAWQFPGLVLVDMVGKVHFDESNMYSCFKVIDEQTGFTAPTALTFALQPLKLDKN